MSYAISVFGNSAPWPGSPDCEMARDLGQRLARSGVTVQTGGYIGTVEGVSHLDDVDKTRTSETTMIREAIWWIQKRLLLAEITIRYLLMDQESREDLIVTMDEMQRKKTWQARLLAAEAARLAAQANRLAATLEDEDNQ